MDAELAQQLINGLSWGAIYALIAVGYTMVYGVLRLINFAHGDVYMVGAYVAFYAATIWFAQPPDEATLRGWHWTLAVVAVPTIAAGALWFARKRRAAGDQSPIAPPDRAKGLFFRAAMVLGLVAIGYVARRWFRPSQTESWVGFAAILLTAMVVAAVLGLVIEFVAYRPLRSQPRINALITAIGISMMLEYGGQRLFGATPRAFPSEVVPKLVSGSREKPNTVYTRGETKVDFRGSDIRIWWPDAKSKIGYGEVLINPLDILILFMALALMVVLRFIVMNTRTGLALRAVSFRFDTAALMGVNIDRIVSFTFVLGSSLAAVAGVLVGARYGKIEPFMGLMPGLKAFIAAVLGGIGNIPGAVAGGFLLGLIETLVAAKIPNGSQYKDGIAFAILICVLLIRPTGLFGKTVSEKV